MSSPYDPVVVTVRFRRVFPHLGHVPRFTSRDVRDCLRGRLPRPLQDMLAQVLRDLAAAQPSPR